MKSIGMHAARTLLGALVFTSWFGGASAAVAESVAAPHGTDGALFATVNGKPLLLKDFDTAFNALLRQKFYHGKVPEGQLEVVRDDVTERMVQRVLLLEEAGRREIVVDEKKVAEVIGGYEGRYAASPVWQKERERLLPGLKQQLSEQNLLEQLEQRVRQVPEPTEAETKAFYEAHLELFTEPEKLRLSLILLGVDPSLPKAAWDTAMEEAKTIHARLQAGADFAETARLHSVGKEAEQGGDLGYLHRGMLPEALQEKIDQFKQGAVAEPMNILEGVAIFRLDDRLPPKQRAFEEVAQRARDLARRDREDGAWTALLAGLKAGADIKLLSRQANSSGGEAHR